MTLNRQRVRSKTAWDAAGLVRKAMTAWILACACQYALLPADLRNLTGLDGLRAMSLGFSLALTGGIFALLCLLSLVCYTGKWERCGIVLGVGVLSALSLLSTFSWGLLGGCVLLMAVERQPGAGAGYPAGQAALWLDYPGADGGICPVCQPVDGGQSV